MQHQISCIFTSVCVAEIDHVGVELKKKSQAKFFLCDKLICYDESKVKFNMCSLTNVCCVVVQPK